MVALACPRCREPYAGQPGTGWLNCQRCQHRWLPTSRPAAATTVAPTEEPALPAAPPIPAAVPVGVSLPPLPPVIRPVNKASISESDEYAPNESGELKGRTAPLINRQSAASAIQADSATASAPVPMGADPFDPDLFERMARDAQVERNRKSPALALPAIPSIPPIPELPAAIPAASPAAPTSLSAHASPNARTAANRQITCPVCGHGFPSNLPEDASQVCPQCHTTFNLAKGHVVSGGGKQTGGDVLLGRALCGCLIDRKVGEGGMGSVYHARQLSLDRSVAVKVLPPELARNRNFISRFEREAKSLARINHPNILHIYDFGEDQQLGVYFMIMEFVEGRDLGDLLHETYTLGQIEVLDILRQAALGLEQAAEKGVIHRDIKPDNLMLTKEGICKVSDFGLAKATMAERDVTTIGVRVGTPAFMSPEQCDGDDVDFRSDIYNLGCTAFLALTGQLPYDADTPFAIMLKHKNDPVPSPRSFNPNLDARVERLVMRMIAKRPADRFDTLRDLVEQVEDLEVKLAGTSTVLRKSRGPFRVMTELEAVEHARMTSSGARPALSDLPDNAPSASASPKAPATSRVPGARAVSTPAPIGQAAVPDWLKPVEDPKPRKTTSNLQAIPTPRPTPQAGTTSQREMKDLRSKLTEARQRNMQDEAHAVVSEGDRLAANGQMALAAEAWTRAATMTPNVAEATSLFQRASKARRGRGFGKLIKLTLGISLLVAGLGIAAFYGVPVGHNLIAARQVEPLRAIAAPQARMTALEDFVATYGRPLDLYVQAFKEGYPILPAEQAKGEIAALKIQLAPPPPKPAPTMSTKADEEMKRLEALRGDQSVPWMTVANEARRIVTSGEAKERAQAILSESEQQLVTMASDYEAIRSQWATGHQGHMVVLSAAFRAKHPRAGSATPAGLPGRVVVVDGDNGGVLPNVQITTRVQVAESGGGVLGGESRLATGDLQFCRYPRNAVTLDITASGYRNERIQVAANQDPAEQVVQVRLQPGEAWRAQVARSPQWLSLQPLTGTPFALVRTPDHLALARLATGELRSPLTRSQLSVPVGSDGAFWTDCLDPRAGGFTVGTTDGLGIELLIDEGALRLGTLLHRGTKPLLAFLDKDLTFQAKRATYAVTAVEQGMSLSAKTSDKDLWTLGGLAGFQRPVLWAQEDRVLVLDDRQLQALDETDGHVLASRPLPGARTGVPLLLPDSNLLAIPTAAGATLMRIAVSGGGEMINEVEDKVLSECRARLLAQDGATVLTASLDKSLRLLGSSAGGFTRIWGAHLPTDAGQPQWLSLAPEVAMIGDDRGAIFLLARTDGTLLRRIVHRALLTCPPLIAEGRLVVGDRDGNVVAYHLPPLPPR